jgi:RNA polymerase sigma factor (sigma-70 family)
MAIETLGAVLRQINRLFSDGAVTGLSDAQLLERFLTERDGAAFEVLMARYGPMVLSVCRGVLRNPSDAEDAFQATFLVLVNKARRLRGRANLGGWLHLVAYRVAIQANAAAARRRVQEREAGEMAAATSTSVPAARDEQLRALHEEIARLPEKFRLAIVLCDLQGIPQNRAAGELQLSERTLRRRLSEGRERLKARLSRRGLPEGGMLGTVVLRESLAAVPPAWAEATVRAALAIVNESITIGVVSAAATKLSHEVLKMMMFQKLKLFSAAILGVGLMAWGASAALISFPEEPPRKTAATPPEQRKAQVAVPQPEADPLDPVGKFPVRGRVLDPDGKPVANAQIYVHHYHFDVMASATSNTVPAYQSGSVAATGPDGHFQFELDKAASDFPYRDFPAWHGAEIAAVAPGFGPAWLSVESLLKGDEAVLRLVPDDVPIRGRVLDSQGRPQAGVTVSVRSIHKLDSTKNFDAILASGELAYTSTSSQYSGPTWLGRNGQWTTDGDGRFEIKGVGRDQVVGLEFFSPTLEKVYLHAMARPARTASKPRPRPTRPNGMRQTGQPPAPPLVGAEFERVFGPTKPITGVVRLKGTDKPLAGVHVIGTAPATWTEVSAVTDGEGRFRLVGLPKVGSYEIRAAPRNGIDPFLGIRKTVTDTAGLKAIETDLELPKGVIVIGKMVDKTTGKALRAKHVMHVNMPTNRNEGSIATSSSGLIDPTFRLTVPPGASMICANIRGPNTLYARARLRPEDKGKGVGGVGDRETMTIPLNAYYAYRIVDIPADAESFAVELELTRGIARTGRVVDPTGKPVVGVQTYGLSPVWGKVATLADDRFEVIGLEPGRPRLLVLAHKDLQFVGSVVLKDADLKTAKPLVVRLDRAGSIKGRLTDEDGLPLAGAKLNTITFDLDGNNLPTGPGGLWPDNETFLTGADGRFQVNGLKSDVKTSIGISTAAHPRGLSHAVNAFRNVTTQPGEIRDLGDIRVKTNQE